MFASDLGSISPTYPVNTLEGKILKHYGGTTLRDLWLQHLAHVVSRGLSRRHVRLDTLGAE